MSSSLGRDGSKTGTGTGLFRRILDLLPDGDLLVDTTAVASLAGSHGHGRYPSCPHPYCPHLWCPQCGYDDGTDDADDRAPLCIGGGWGDWGGGAPALCAFESYADEFCHLLLDNLVLAIEWGSMVSSRQSTIVSSKSSTDWRA